MSRVALQKEDPDISGLSAYVRGKVSATAISAHSKWYTHTHLSMYKFAELVLVMMVVSFVRLSGGLGHRTESTEVLLTEVG